jgi:hypothetical protein
MFAWRRSNIQSELGIVLNMAIHDLRHHRIGSEEYEKTLTYVTQIQRIKENESKKSVSRETMLVVGANLLGILLIIKHENVNVITSKALGFVLKPK